MLQIKFDLNAQVTPGIKAEIGIFIAIQFR